jgi:hypothetical protein
VLEGRDADVPPDRYREHRYEGLVADPERELRALAPWLGLDYTGAMLAYPDRPLTVPHAEHHRRLALAPTPGLRDWRTQMAAADVVRFRTVAGDALDLLGYA